MVSTCSSDSGETTIAGRGFYHYIAARKLLSSMRDPSTEDVVTDIRFKITSYMIPMIATIIIIIHFKFYALMYKEPEG